MFAAEFECGYSSLQRGDERQQFRCLFAVDYPPPKVMVADRRESFDDGHDPVTFNAHDSRWR